VWNGARTALEQPQVMAGKRYPQFLLIGDSIVQFSSLLRDGFCFGAGLEERESLLGYLECTLAGSHLYQFVSGLQASDD
jgi:hypothetical protein